MRRGVIRAQQTFWIVSCAGRHLGGLNQHVNGKRTNFTFPVSRDSTDEMFDDITLDGIRGPALDCVSADLQPFLQEINTEKRTAINNYITTEGPQYRPLTRYMEEFIDRIPPGARGLTLESLLHEQMYQKQRELKNESHALMDENTKAALKPEEYEAKINDFLERANELGKIISRAVRRAPARHS